MAADAPLCSVRAREVTGFLGVHMQCGLLRLLSHPGDL